MRRKLGTLIPIEVSILDAGLDLERRGNEDFHGYLLATEIADREDARRLLAHGSLYRALGRMERDGLLESRWENADLAAAAERPRRRLYRVTLAGARAVAVAPVARAAPAARPRTRRAPA